MNLLSLTYEKIKEFDVNYIEGGSEYFIIDNSIVFLLSVMSSPCTYTAVFKDAEQVLKLFGVDELRKLNSFEVMFFVEAHKGTARHCGFSTEHAMFDRFHEKAQKRLLKLIRTGTFDFRDFEVSDNFDMFGYVKQTYPNFKPSF
jgi:hypothetical protein